MPDLKSESNFVSPDTVPERLEGDRVEQSPREEDFDSVRVQQQQRIATIKALCRQVREIYTLVNQEQSTRQEPLEEGIDLERDDIVASIDVQRTVVTSLHRELNTLLKDTCGSVRPDLSVLAGLLFNLEKIVDIGRRYQPATVRLQQLQHAAHERFTRAEAALFEEYGVEDSHAYDRAIMQAYDKAGGLERTWLGLGKYLHQKDIGRLLSGAATMQDRYADIRLDPEIVKSPNVHRNLDYELQNLASEIGYAVAEHYIGKLRQARQGYDAMLALGDRSIKPKNVEQRDIPDNVMREIETHIRNTIIDRRVASYKVSETKIADFKQQVATFAMDAEDVRFNDYGWNTSEEEQARAQDLRDRLNDFPYWAGLDYMQFGPYLRDEVISLFNTSEALTSRSEFMQLTDEAAEVQHTLESFSINSSDWLSRQLKIAIETLSKNTLSKYPWYTWHALADAPASVQVLGAEHIGRITHELHIAVRDQLRITPEHTEASNKFSYWLMECDGPEFAEYAVLNAWREPGMSGEMPFIGLHGNGRDAKVFHYIEKQSEATLVEIAENNPALGKIITEIRAHPDTFTRHVLDDPEAISGEYKTISNPVYERIQTNLLGAAAELLSRDDPADQFFALGLLKAVRRPIEHNQYERLSSILKTTHNTALRAEIVSMITDRTSHRKDKEAMYFLARHFDLLSEAERKRASWSQNELITQIVVAEDVDDTIHDVVGTLLDLPPDAVRALPRIHEALGKPGSGDFRERPFLQPSDTSVIIHLAKHHDEFFQSLRQVKEWLPDFSLQPMMWFRHGAGNHLLPPNVQVVLYENRYQPAIRTALLGYVEQHDAVPPGLAEAIVQQIDCGDVDPEIAEERTDACLRFAADTSISAEVRDYVYNPQGITTAVQMEPEQYAAIAETIGQVDTLLQVVSAEARKSLGLFYTMKRMFSMHEADLKSYTEFIVNMDRSFAWSEVQRFITRAEQEGYVDVSKPEDQRVVAGFMGEFGTAGSVTLFNYYSQLMKNEPVAEELVELGVRHSGSTGVNELRRAVRAVRAEVIRNDAVLGIDNPLRQEVASTVLRFETSQWSRSGKRVANIINRLNRDSADGNIAALPAEYEVSGDNVHTMHVARLDADKIKEFKFSNGFKHRYAQLIESFAPVREGLEEQKLIEDIKARVIARTEEEVAELTKKITLFHQQGKPEIVVRGVTAARMRYEQLAESLKQSVKVSEVFSALLQFDRKDNDLTTPAIRELLLVHAHEVNPGYSGDIHFLSLTEATRDGSIKMMTYIEDLVLAETLPQLELDKKAQSRVRDIFNFRSFNDELQRLEVYAKKGIQEIVCIPSSGVLAEFSGYFGDACWTRQDNIVRDNPDMVGVAFVQNLGNEANERIVGSCLLFERTTQGEPVLIIRGINPIQNIITHLDASSFVQEFLAYIAPIARQRGATKILAPLETVGALTNRPTLNAALRNEFSNNTVVQLDQPMTFNGYYFNTAVELMDLST